MRVTQFRKVEGHESLVRDMESNAILSTNDEEYKLFMARKQHAMTTASIMKKNEDDIRELKNGLGEIKKMLLSIMKE